jgi:hypothetical protein
MVKFTILFLLLSTAGVDGLMTGLLPRVTAMAAPRLLMALRGEIML